MVGMKTAKFTKLVFSSDTGKEEEYIDQFWNQTKDQWMVNLNFGA